MTQQTNKQTQQQAAAGRIFGKAAAADMQAGFVAEAFLHSAPTRYKPRKVFYKALNAPGYAMRGGHGFTITTATRYTTPAGVLRAASAYNAERVAAGKAAFNWRAVARKDYTTPPGFVAKMPQGKKAARDWRQDCKTAGEYLARCGLAMLLISAAAIDGGALLACAAIAKAAKQQQQPARIYDNAERVIDEAAYYHGGIAGYCQNLIDTMRQELTNAGSVLRQHDFAAAEAHCDNAAAAYKRLPAGSSDPYKLATHICRAQKHIAASEMGAAIGAIEDSDFANAAIGSSPGALKALDMLCDYGIAAFANNALQTQRRRIADGIGGAMDWQDNEPPYVPTPDPLAVWDQRAADYWRQRWQQKDKQAGHITTPALALLVIIAGVLLVLIGADMFAAIMPALACALPARKETKATCPPATGAATGGGYIVAWRDPVIGLWCFAAKYFCGDVAPIFSEDNKPSEAFVFNTRLAAWQWAAEYFTKAPEQKRRVKVLPAACGVRWQDKVERALDARYQQQGAPGIAEVKAAGGLLNYWQGKAAINTRATQQQQQAQAPATQRRIAAYKHGGGGGYYCPQAAAAFYSRALQAAFAIWQRGKAALLCARPVFVYMDGFYYGFAADADALADLGFTLCRRGDLREASFHASRRRHVAAAMDGNEPLYLSAAPATMPHCQQQQTQQDGAADMSPAMRGGYIQDGGRVMVETGNAPPFVDYYFAETKHGFIRMRRYCDRWQVALTINSYILPTRFAARLALAIYNAARRALPANANAAAINDYLATHGERLRLECKPALQAAK